MAQITPPVGFNLFVLQGMTNRQITWIARQTIPMFVLMCVAVAWCGSGRRSSCGFRRT